MARAKKEENGETNQENYYAQGRIGITKSKILQTIATKVSTTSATTATVAATVATAVAKTKTISTKR